MDFSHGEKNCFLSPPTHIQNKIPDLSGKNKIVKLSVFLLKNTILMTLGGKGCLKTQKTKPINLIT